MSLSFPSSCGIWPPSCIVPNASWTWCCIIKQSFNNQTKFLWLFTALATLIMRRFSRWQCTYSAFQWMSQSNFLNRHNDHNTTRLLHIGQNVAVIKWFSIQICNMTHGNIFFMYGMVSGMILPNSKAHPILERKCLWNCRLKLLLHWIQQPLCV